MGDIVSGYPIEMHNAGYEFAPANYSWNAVRFWCLFSIGEFLNHTHAAVERSQGRIE